MHTHIHICTCAYMPSCTCVYHLLSVDGRWDGKGVQDPKGYATAHHKHGQNLFFVTNYSKVRNYNFLNNNICDWIYENRPYQHKK